MQGVDTLTTATLRGGLKEDVMHHQLRQSSLRFLRVSTSAWAIAVLVAVFEQVSSVTFNVALPFQGALHLGAQSLFGFGCVAAFGTAGLRILSRAGLN